ncbi:hypothetical protein Nepgr_014057 [Nepenthes gracilis]|uniref:Bifunctional inhibitor/plant lipid transfer protein/seed storage helical domain-containing protein n=1 Tax=Nepenthes gracilis TaxID=150966 RepID=A0AAD3SKA4_NEPGR|nr:hypothetical protein Nepgr_014057 [Nepenthes gracilis]
MAITIWTAAVAALVLAAVICLGQVEATTAEGPAAAPAPAGPDCLTVLASAFDCLDYLEAGSNKSAPGKVCCNEVTGLLKQDDGPLCLCELLANPSASGFDVDKKRALKLPTACGIQADPITLCQVIGVSIPTSGPSPSPSPSAVSGAEPSPSPAEEVPTSPPSTSTVPASPSLSPPQSGALSHRPRSLALFVGFAITFIPSLLSF